MQAEKAKAADAKPSSSATSTNTAQLVAKDKGKPASAAEKNGKKQPADKAAGAVNGAAAPVATESSANGAAPAAATPPQQVDRFVTCNMQSC